MKSTLKILVDLDCELWIDQTFVSQLTKGVILKLPIISGKYIIEFKYENNTIKYLEYQIPENVEEFIKVKLTRKITVNIIERLKMLYGCLFVEGDRIDEELISSSISFDGINWEEVNSHTWIKPINFCGVMLKFDYGCILFNYDNPRESETLISNSYTHTIFLKTMENIIIDGE